MKVLILAGSQANQRALCHKIAKVCDLSAIVVSENVPRKKPDLRRRTRSIINRMGNRIVGRQLAEAWSKTLAVYERSFPKFPDVPIVNVRNVNDDATLESLRRYSPDLTIVSGTNLVGTQVIDVANTGSGIVNMHTGISPYVKGGPNCTNWCLAKNWFHLIGNTVMWLDPGIDTGKIIATERTALTGKETLPELHMNVMEHAHELYTRSIRRIAEGGKVRSVPQNSIGEGRLFYAAEWNMSAMRNAVGNFHKNYAQFFDDWDKNRELIESITLVDLIY